MLVQRRIFGRLSILLTAFTLVMAGTIVAGAAVVRSSVPPVKHVLKAHTTTLPSSTTSAASLYLSNWSNIRRYGWHPN